MKNNKEELRKTEIESFLNYQKKINKSSNLLSYNNNNQSKLIL
jgi:hypothetical protein